MVKRIKSVVAFYVKNFDTNNPFMIAENLGIQVFTLPIGNLSGYYKYLKRTRCIFINSEIEDENYKRIVMAHELGHAVLHLKENCYFMHNKTLLLTSKIERQANIFAAELLIPDVSIKEYFGRGYTLDQVAEEQNVYKELVSLKLENLSWSMIL